MHARVGFESQAGIETSGDYHFAGGAPLITI
jgi:hypothetical protein